MSTSTQKAESWLALKFITPALIAMMFVHFIPIVLGIYISLIDLDKTTLTQLFGAPFIGVQNFVEIFSSNLEFGERFLQSIVNIVEYNLIVIPSIMVIGMAVALLLNQKFKGRLLVRGLILLPYITPDSVMYSAWRFIFQSKIGIVNHYLMKFSIIDEPLIWLVGEKSLFAVIIASVWKGWPFITLILLARMQGISKEYYEAARLDGASTIQRFTNITLPLLWPTCKTLLLLSFIWNFNAFNQFFVLLGGGASKEAAVPSIVILRTAFSNLHYGLGSAMAVVMLAVLFLVTTASLLKRKEV